MAPASDFYKKLALECSSQQIAVDLFAFSGQFIDLTTMCECGKMSLDDPRCGSQGHMMTSSSLRQRRKRV